MSETYISELKREISDIRTATKGGLPRVERLAWIKRVGNRYKRKHAEHNEPTRLKAQSDGREPKFAPMDTYLLDQLTNLALYEELTSTQSNKATATEYPFLSELQLARRRDGAHEAKGTVQKGEAPFTNVANFGQDGRDYSVPTRRKRSDYENIKRDEAVYSRNKEYKRRYDEFTKAQPVITYIMPEKLS
jgi:hypothetical protein